MKLEIFKVCKQCLSPGITYPDCICCYTNGYPTIELEFEICECCGNIHETPAYTEFNKKQFENDKTRNSKRN